MLLPVFLLNRRWYIAALLGAAGLYVHMGVPVLFFLGLLLFGILHRRYLADVLAALALSAALAAPWYGHIWHFVDWFGHPVDAGVWGEYGPWERAMVKLLFLQNINLLLVFLVWRGLRMVNRRDVRTVILLCLGVGLLPMLITYGGRYYIHSVPIWCIVAGAGLVPFLQPRVRWRRLVAITAIALIAPYVAFFSAFYPDRPPRILPMPSGWLVPPAFAFAGWEFMRKGERLGFPWGDIQAVGDYVRENSPPDEIIHVDAPGRLDQHIAGALAWAASRPIDTALWEEVSPPPIVLDLLETRSSREASGIYVRLARGFRAKPPPLPMNAEWRRFGRFEVAICSQ
jgi:hypothetical protein